MRTLDQAIEERKAELEEQARKRAMEEARRLELESELENQVVELFCSLMEQRYNLLPRSIGFKASRLDDGTYTLSAMIATDDNDIGYIELSNPVALAQDGADIAIVIRELREFADEWWKAGHSGHYLTYRNMLDAAIYAKAGI